MMEAVYIELLPQMLEHATTVFEDIIADGPEFIQVVRRAGYPPPTAAAASTDSRFRLFLKVPGRQELNGVYFVGGWRDKGTVSLSWDPHQDYLMPRRREAIMATRAKNRAEAGG